MDVAYWIVSALIGSWACTGYLFLRFPRDASGRHRLEAGWLITGTLLALVWAGSNWYIQSEPLSRRAFYFTTAFVVGAALRFMVGIPKTTIRQRESIGERDLEELFQRIRNDVKENGNQQARSAGLRIMGEAEKLLESCSVLSKPRVPEAWLDFALALLSYPPELAFLIAAQFSELEGRLGYQPFSTIIIAMGNMDRLYQGTFARRSAVAAPELSRVIQDPQLRRERAASFVAVALILTAQNLEMARELYRESVSQLSLKPLIEQALQNYAGKVALAIYG